MKNAGNPAGIIKSFEGDNNEDNFDRLKKELIKMTF